MSQLQVENLLLLHHNMLNV